MLPALSIRVTNASWPPLRNWSKTPAVAGKSSECVLAADGHRPVVIDAQAVAVVPTQAAEKVDQTRALPEGLKRVTKASLAPPKVVSTAPLVVGKVVDHVVPHTVVYPAASTRCPRPSRSRRRRGRWTR